MLTNSMLKISVPGKMILCGEHAVLYGYSAISFAINQRMYVKISKIESNNVVINSHFGRVELSCEEILGDKKKVSLDAWYDSLFFLLAKMQIVGIEIEIESHILNYGFGSSGALFAAVCCGLLLFQHGDMEKEKLLKQTLELYFEYHKNSLLIPSGIDVVTSISGGVVHYNRKHQEVMMLDGNIFHDWQIFAIWTGHKTSTLDASHVANNAHNSQDIYKQINLLTNNAISAITDGNIDDLCDILLQQQKFLAALNLVDKSTHDILQQCSKQNVCCKISGSGLGDCVMAICKKGTTFDIHGYNCVDIAIDNMGLNYEFL